MRVEKIKRKLIKAFVNRCIGQQNSYLSLGLPSCEKNCLNNTKCSSLNLWEDANRDITFWKYRLRAAINDHFQSTNRYYCGLLNI